MANVLHDSPVSPPRFGILGAGATMLVSMFVISYGTYVYANVMKSPHDMYLQVTSLNIQHLSVTSHIAILALVYGVLFAASPAWLLIIMTILYACGAIYMHFRVYNRCCKPTLFEMLVLAILIAAFYSANSYFYYVCFSLIFQPTTTIGATHQLLRSFHQQSLW